MFSVRAFSRLVSLVVALMMVVGLSPEVQGQTSVPEEYYREVEVDGVLIGFGNNNDSSEWRRPGRYVNTEMTPGKNYNFFAVLFAPELQEPLDDVKFSLTYAKADHVESIPEFPDHPQASRKEVWEDEEAYYADYYFDQIDRGADIRIPLEMLHKNGTTLKGARNRVSADMYVAGIPYASNSALFTSRLVPTVGAHTEISEGINKEVWMGEWGAPAHEFFVEDLETQGWRTPEEGAAITYQINTHLDSETTGENDLFNDSYRVDVTVEEYVKPHPDSLANGWVYDEDAKTLTFESDTLTSECVARNDRNEFRNCKTLKLLYVHAPVAVNNKWNGWPLNWYSFPAKVTYFYQGAPVATESFHSSPVAFVPAELPREGRTHKVNIEKKTVGIRKDYRRNISDHLTVGNGNIYSGEVVLGPGGNEPVGMQWETEISQQNNGAGPGILSWGQTATGGIKDHVQRIVEKDLDPRLYFYNFKLRLDSWAGNSNALLKDPEILARIDGTENVVWGVTAAGEKVEIARDIDANQKIEINDTSRRFEKLEIEFRTPLEVDNFKFYLDVAAFPLADELAKWDRQEYLENQVYPTTTLIEYRADGEEGAQIKSATAKHTLVPTSRELNLRTIVYENTVRITYPACRADGTPSVATAESRPCDSFTSFSIESGTGSALNVWGPYDKPLQDLKHIYLIPEGFEYGGIERHWVYGQYQGPEPQAEVIENFEGTGKTAVILSMGDVIHSFGRYKDGTTTSIRLLDKVGTRAGTYQLEAFATWKNNDEIVPGLTSEKFKDVFDFDKDGDIVENFVRVQVPLVYERPGELVATKKASVDGVSFREGTVHQEINGPVDFEITVTNNSDQEVRQITVADVFPRTDDFRWGSGTETLQPRQWLLGSELKQHSGFNVPLTGPVTDIRLVRKGVTRQLPVDYVSYALLPGTSDFDTWYNQTWVPATEVTDWAQVVAMKYSHRYLSLRPGDSLVVRTKNVVRSDQSELSEGTTAINHAVYGSVDDLQETLPVEIQLAKYDVSGTAFEDVDGNGVHSLGEPLIANVPFTVVDATSGEVVTNALGQPLTGTTDERGGYSVQIPRSGEYRIRFEKQTGQIFAKGGEGNDASHVAVCSDSGENFTGSSGIMGFIARATGLGNAGALQNNCDGRYAKTHNFGWTNAFVLNPTNVTETRNVGMDAPLGIVTIAKRDQYGQPVSGAQFTLTWKSATGTTPDPLPAPKTGTTGDDGVAMIEGLPFGEYVLTESGTPTGYRGLAAAMDIVVTGNLDPVQVTNELIEGKIVVTKLDADNRRPISGTKFMVHGQDGQVVRAEMTTNDQGKVTFTNLRPGQYQVVETAPADGYQLPDDPVHVVTVPADGQDTFLEVVNTPITGEIQILKTEIPTHKPLAGAVFSLQTLDGVEVDTQTSGPDGRLRFTNVRPGEYHVVETTAPEHYKKLEYPLYFEITNQGETKELEVGNIRAVGTVQFTKVDARTGQPIEGAEFDMYRDGQWFAKSWSNSEGLVKFRRVFYGDYTIVETNPAPGYATGNYRTEVSIREDDQVVDLGKVENTPLVGSLEFTKVDAVTLSPILGAEFGLFHGDELRYRAESNADGVVRFSDIPYGTYTLKETQAPAGYVYDPQEREVTISEGSRSVFGEVLNVPYVSTVHLRKVDAVSRQPLAGAEFGLFNDRAEEVARATTRQDGQVAFPQVRPGFYTLVELEAPVGYQRVPEPIEVLVPPQGQAVDLGDVTNAPITGDVVLTKVDGTTGEPLPGTHFELRQGHNTIAQAVTDQWGMLRFETIPFGSYTLVETQPAPGFVATTDQWTVTIAEPDQVVNLGVVENQPVTGSIELTKVDAVTKTPLAGAVFALKDGEQELARATSTEEGLVHFDTARAGQYTVVELAAPAGYQVRTEPIPVTVAGDGQTVRVGTVENHPIIGGIRLRKVDAVDPTITLPGVTFALLAANGAIVQEQVTGSDGSLTFENVPFGTYQVVETKATEGYVLADQRMQVTVTEHGKILDLGPVGNTRIVGEVALTKLEAGTARALAGVGFELRTPGGAVVAAGTTDQQGSLTFPGVSYGSYELVETAALPGFQALSKPIPVSVLEHGKTVHVGQVPNERIRGDITIKAVDKETKKPLAGATFELVGEGGTVAEATSNGEGIVRFNSHLWGNYALVETREPAGYLPTNTRIPVVIHTHGEVVDAGVVEYSRPPAPSVNPPGPGGLWKIFIPFLFLVGIDGNGSSNPQPGTYHQVPQPPVEQPVGAPAAPAEQPEAQVTTLAVTGSEVLPLVGVALLLMLAGAVILRRRS